MRSAQRTYPVREGGFAADTASPHSTGESAMADKTEGARLSVKLSPKATDQLRELTERRGITLTNAVQRAIDLLYFVEMLEPHEAATFQKDALGAPYAEKTAAPQLAGTRAVAGT